MELKVKHISSNTVHGFEEQLQEFLATLDTYKELQYNSSLAYGGHKLYSAVIIYLTAHITDGDKS